MSYTPILGGSQNNKFSLQFNRSGVNPTSLACTLIKQLSNDGSDSVISHGSGCFWRHKNYVFLLTARHVITGLSPFDNRILSENGFIPNKITIYPTVVSPETWYRKTITINIDHNEPNYLEDPEFETLRTDISALYIGEDEDSKIRCLNDQTDIFDDLYTLVGMECSVVGYPTSMFSDLMTPIWRRGSIASEPMLPIDGKPMFLLDAATSPGFSGSPVLRQHFGPLPVQQPDKSVNVLMDNVRTISFVGIYAGRLKHVHASGEVPFVFYGNRVPRLFDGL